MGAAHATVINQSTRPLAVITFNMAELIYKSYHTLYIIEPGESQLVEANPDPIGLKVGIVYDTLAPGQELLFHRFSCRNDSVLTVTAVDGQDIDYYGDGTSLQTKGKLREAESEPFNMAAATLNHTLASAHAPGQAAQAAAAAGEGVKKLLRKVKDGGEAAIKTVTGKEVALGFGGNQRAASPSEGMFEDVSQLTEDSYHSRAPPNMSSLSKPPIIRTNSVSSSNSYSNLQAQGQGQGQGNATSAALKMFGAASTSVLGAPGGASGGAGGTGAASGRGDPQIQANGSRRPPMPPAFSGPGPSGSGGGAAIGDRPRTGTASSSQPFRPPSSVKSPPSPPTAPTPPPSAADQLSSAERFAQELERKKKEQVWEEEVRRIKREREEAIRNPPPPQEKHIRVEKVEAGCHVCVIS